MRVWMHAAALATLAVPTYGDWVYTAPSRDPMVHLESARNAAYNMRLRMLENDPVAHELMEEFEDDVIHPLARAHALMTHRCNCSCA